MKAWSRDKILIIFASIFLLTLTHAKADTAWCKDDLACPTPFSSLCDCYSTLQGVDCYIVYCADINNDGCYELDFANKVKCPHECEMVGTYTAECKHEPKPCQDECIQAGTFCVGEWLDVQGHTKNILKCGDDNGDGCLEIQSITSCSLYCVPNGASSYCEWQQPPPICQDTCQSGETQCFFAGQNEYMEECGSWDDDTCLEFPSQTVPQDTLPSFGITYCPFGCDEPQPNHARCMIEPQKCLSTCSENDKKCGGEGSYLYNCQYNPDLDCWDYFDSDGNAYDVTNCGENAICIETTKNKAYCSLGISAKPTLNLTSSTYGCQPPSCSEPSHNNPYGLAKIGAYLYGYDFGDFPYLFKYNVETLAYVSNVTMPSCNLTIGGYAWVAGDGNYLYGSWYDDSGYNIISKFSINPSLCLGNVLNASLTITSFDVSDNYIWLTDVAYAKVWQYNKTGSLIRSWTDSGWNLDPNVQIKVCGDDNFVWVTDTWNNKTKRYSSLGKYTDIYLNDTVWDSCDIANQIYATDFTFGDWNFLRKYDYGDMILRDRCALGSRKCSSDMYVDGRWIRPYLIYCGDWNNDGYNEWATAENGGTGYTCQYGCELNTTLNDFACRLSPPVNCTDKDWICLPDTTRCNNDWIQKCSMPYSDNCYTWVDQFPCANGCYDDKTCNSCTSECLPTESRCFNEGGFESQKLQKSLYFGVPIIANCSFDYNQRCWLWSTAEIERCVYGCYENFSYDLNTTNAYCHTNQTMNAYYVLDFAGMMKNFMSFISSIFTTIMPETTTRYIFTILTTLVITVAVMIKRNWKFGLLTFIVITLFSSLIGWLPIWVTPIYILLVGIYLMQKFWFKGE